MNQDQLLTLKGITLSIAEWQAIIDRHTVKSTDPKACYQWTGNIGQNGYARFTLSRNGVRKSFEVHRVIACLKSSCELPSHVLACHKCDNKTCSNPRHIYLGNHTTNLIDAHTRDRRTIDTKNPEKRRQLNYDSILDEPSVVFIKRLLIAGAKHKVIANHCGVARSTITDIANGNRWGWVKPFLC